MTLVSAPELRLNGNELLSHWIHEARDVLGASPTDFFAHKPSHYWMTMIVSTSVAYAAASWFLMAPLGSWQQLVAYPLAIFWLYRAGSMVHEVAHLPQHKMRLFKVTWNLLVGVVTLSPSPFFTRHHRDHHSVRQYGTTEDPEYVRNFMPAGSSAITRYFLMEVLLFPLVVFLRFLVVPLTYIHPNLRELFLRRASSLTPNLRYERKLSDLDRQTIAAVEILCWLRAIIIPLAVVLGWTEWTRLPLLYSLAVGAIGLNQLRLLSDHLLESDGRPLDVHGQLIDSCNYVQRDFLTWLFYPNSIRYHALHHLFPSLPYHNLAAAHRMLIDNVAYDSPYRQLEQPGWWYVASQSIRQLHATGVGL